MLRLLCLVSAVAALQATFPRTDELLATDREPWFELSTNSLDNLRGSAILQTVKHPELRNIFCDDKCRASIQWFIDNHEKFNLSAYDVIQINHSIIILLRIRNTDSKSGVSMVIHTGGIPYPIPPPGPEQLLGILLVGGIGFLIFGNCFTRISFF